MVGVKAGALAGLIQGVIATGIFAATFDWLISSLITTVPPGLDLETYKQLLYFSLVYGSAVSGLINGIIMGVIFAIIYDYLPTEKPIYKAFTMGILFWIISLALVAGILAPIWIGIQFVLGVIIFGYLLGYFWTKFGGATEEE